MGAGAGAAGAVGGAADVSVSVVAGVVVAVAVVEDAEFWAGPLVGWEVSIVFGDDIVSCMGVVSFFVTESAIEWSKGPVKVVSKPVAHLRRD